MPSQDVVLTNRILRGQLAMLANTPKVADEMKLICRAIEDVNLWMDRSLTQRTQILDEIRAIKNRLADLERKVR